MKGQMEIMGLVVIVMLLSVGLLFVIKFVYLEPESNPRSEQLDSQLAANLLNSMVQSTATNCSNQKIKALFSDCAAGEEIRCDNGMYSCEYLNKTMHEILDATLGEWNRDYYFNATNTARNFCTGVSCRGNEDIEIGTPCQGNYDLKFHPIQSDTKLVTVNLMICGN